MQRLLEELPWMRTEGNYTLPIKNIYLLSSLLGIVRIIINPFLGFLFFLLFPSFDAHFGVF